MNLDARHFKMSYPVKSLNENIFFVSALPFILISSLIFTGCLSNGGKAAAGAASASSALTGLLGVTPSPGALPGAGTSSVSFSIANLIIAASGSASGDGTTPLVSTVYFASTTPSHLTDVCTAGPSSPKPCKCRYSWSEINAIGGGGITRVADTSIVALSAYQATCTPPSVYTSEIADGTTVRLTVVADAVGGNTSQFTSNTWVFAKSSGMVSADFRDAEGRAIKNVMHYVCYDKTSKSLSIAHRMRPGTPRASGSTPMVSLANRFDLSNVDYSAQNYYYDFYVRSDSIGSINYGNAGFECPQVTVESAGALVTRAYPLDSQFALALQAGGKYTIPVLANTTLDLASGGVSQSQVLGYAAKPASDGTCPAFTDTIGLTRRTFRLRKYTIAYPVRYKADGTMLGGTQPSNTLYIVDRPVDKAGQNPVKPLTRLGPKPCPFALKTAQFGYACTSNLPSGINAVNIDGTAIAAQTSCPIFPPPASDKMPNGALAIRPMEPWTPAYLEDTAFQACVFQSTKPVDPDMVAVNDSLQTPSNYYCAKYYPDHAWIAPPVFSSGFDKMPSSCEATHPAWNAAQVDPPAGSGDAINGKATYACAFTYNPGMATSYDAFASGSSLTTPRSGCCAKCSGNGCGAATARNAAADGTPKLLADHPRLSKPNPTLAVDWQKGCFDPSEDP